MNKLTGLIFLFVFTANVFAADESYLSVEEFGESGLNFTLQLPDAPADRQDLLTSEGFIWIDDETAIPAITRWVLVPAGYKVESDIVSRQSYIADVAPTAVANSVNWDEIDRFDNIDLNPPVAVSITEPMNMGGYMVVPVTIYPLQMSTDRTSAIENRLLDVEISFTPDPSAEYAQSPATLNPVSDAARMIDKIVVNRPRRDPGERQHQYREKILIIHQDQNFNAAQRWLDSLVTWKMQCGYEVQTLPLSNQMNPIDVRRQIREIYNAGLENGHPLRHVIIIGKRDRIGGPALSFPTFQYADQQVGDHYYSIMVPRQGGDAILYSDVTIGRFNNPTAATFAGAVMRSIDYERNPYRAEGDHWFSHALFTAENIAAPGGQFVPSMIHLARWFADKWLEMGYTEIDTIFGEGVIELSRPIMEEEGVGVAFSRGWLEGCRRADGSWIHNGRKNMFAAAVTCLSWEIQEGFFSAATSYDAYHGPCASIMVTGLTNTKTNNSFMGGFMRAMRYFNLHKAGEIQFFGKYQMISDYRFDPSVWLQVETTMAYTTLQGDPSLNIFFANPVELHAEHKEDITVGETGFNVYVTEGENSSSPDAIVTLWQKPDGIHLVTTPGDDGWARFTFGEDAIEPGELILTIVGDNHFPYITTIPVVDDDPVMIDVTNVQFEFDEEENPDALFGRGFTIPTTLTLHNSGGNAANNARAILTTEDDSLTFDPDTISLGNIAANGSFDAEFDLQISINNPYGTMELDSFDALQPIQRTMRIDVEVMSGDESWTHAIDIPSSGPLWWVSVVGGGTLNRGQNAIEVQPTISNDGDMESPGFTATLVSLNPGWVSVIPNFATQTYSAIATGGERNPNRNFRVDVNQRAIPGNLAKFRLDIQSTDQQDDFTTQLYFSKYIGGRRPEEVDETDPLGPDEYGYMCFDSYDDDGGWNKAPRFRWREINPAIRGYDFEGEFLDIGDIGVDRDSSVVIVFPENFRFKYYGQEFDTMIVCSNGWIAFGGENSMFPDFRNWQIPGNQGPDAQVCPMWQDFQNPQPGDRGIFAHYVEEEGIFIIEWSKLEIYRGPPDLLEFQVILYDADQWGTEATGDSEIKFQYKTMVIHKGDNLDNHYFTTGIKNLDNSGGLQYSYWGRFEGAARPLESGMALLFTTDVYQRIGSVEGAVTDMETNQPMQGVTVLANPSGYSAVTDVQGRYQIDDIPIGTSVIEISHPGYNRYRGNVEVVENQSGSVNAALTHPEISVENAGFERTILQYQSTEYVVSVSSEGNGPLEFDLSSRYYDGSPTDYDTTRCINVSAMRAINDNAIHGVEILWKEMYVTGGNYTGGVVDNTLDNYIYVLDHDGNYIREFRQPSRSVSGFFDLAFDGRYFYGGEFYSDTLSWLVRFDKNGTNARRYIIDGKNDAPLLDYPRALAYNPRNGTILAAYESSRIFEFMVQGPDSSFLVPVNEYELKLPGEDLNIWGMAWNEADTLMPLYVLDIMQNQEQGLTQMRLVRYNPTVAGSREVVDTLAINNNDKGYGLGLGLYWNPGKITIATIGGEPIESAPDVIRMYEVGPDTRFLSYYQGPYVVPAQNSQDITLSFSAPDILLPAVYEAGVHITHNALDESITIPVRLIIEPNPDFTDDDTRIPSKFFLEHAYPNPFNGTTRIQFSLEHSGHAVLKVFDIAGREVAALADGEFTAGSHNVTFDAVSLPSGIYIYRLEASGQNAVKRMVLLK